MIIGLSIYTVASLGCAIATDVTTLIGLRFVQGLAGGAIALAIVAAALAALNYEVRPLAESYGSTFRFGFLTPLEACGVVALAGLLGLAGAQLSVSRHLREFEPQ